MARKTRTKTAAPARRLSAKPTGRRPARSGKGKRWSRAVTERSNALDLEKRVFTKSPRDMALSLKRSAERSKRRKGSPFQSAMSMLTFFANRAGKSLSAARKRAIRRAKAELRKIYRRPSRRKGG